MDAEKLAMQRRIDTLDQYATRLHATLTEYERENARLKADLEKAKIQNQYISEVADTYEKDFEKLVRERDALRYDLLHLACDCIPACSICKHYTIGTEMCPHVKEIGAQDIDDCFEWRGLCESNGGKDGKETQSDR